MRAQHGALAGSDQDVEKLRHKQAVEVHHQGLQQLKKAQMAQGEQAAVEFEACVRLFSQAVDHHPTKAQYYLSRGNCFMKMQQYQRALSDFSMCVRYDPSSAKNFGLRGQCYRRLGRAEDALRDYDEAIRMEKDRPEYWFERSLVLMELEQYERAIDGFTKSLDHRLATPFKAYFNRGVCYRHTAQLEESISNLRQAINLDSGNADAYNHLGLSYVEVRTTAGQGNFDEANKCFSSAVELDPCARYLENRGCACYHQKQYKEAIEDFTAALEAEPNNASIHFHLGNTRYQLGEHRDALANYADAIKLEPDNATYLHYKGLAYQGCGMVREAILHYEEALRRDENHHPSRFHLGIMYHHDGQYDRALEALNGGVPADEALYEARGLVHRDTGDYRSALRDFDAVIELDPTEGRHRYNRGVVYHRMGQEQDAIEDLSKAIELGSTEAAVHSERGLAWRALGNMAQAVIDLTAAIDVDDTQTSYLSSRAQCFFEHGLYDRAEADLSRALRLDHEDAELLYKRGICRYAQRNYAEAVADLKSALQRDPYPEHLADIFYHLGVSYANLGKHTLAVLAYDQAVIRGPGKPHYLHERAKSLQVAGEHERALHDFSKVISMQPTNARAMFRRAFSFKARGMYEDAAEDFEAAKEFAPDDPRLVVNYRKVYSHACISLGPCGHEDPKPQVLVS